MSFYFQYTNIQTNVCATVSKLAIYETKAKQQQQQQYTADIINGWLVLHNCAACRIVVVIYSRPQMKAKTAMQM